MTPDEEHSEAHSTNEHSFDELAKGLARENLTRRDALKWVGAAVVGGLLSAIPGVALAKPPPHGTPPGQGGTIPGQGGTPPGQGTTTTTLAPTTTTTTTEAPTTSTTTTLAPTTTTSTSTTTTPPPVTCAQNPCDPGDMCCDLPGGQGVACLNTCAQIGSCGTGEMCCEASCPPDSQSPEHATCVRTCAITTCPTGIPTRPVGCCEAICTPRRQPATCAVGCTG